MSRIESCVNCENDTGRSGIGEDSRYTSYGVGPLCDDCFDLLKDYPPTRYRRHNWSREVDNEAVPVPAKKKRERKPENVRIWFVIRTSATNAAVRQAVAFNSAGLNNIANALGAVIVGAPKVERIGER